METNEIISFGMFLAAIDTLTDCFKMEIEEEKRQKEIEDYSKKLFLIQKDDLKKLGESIEKLKAHAMKVAKENKTLKSILKTVNEHLLPELEQLRTENKSLKEENEKFRNR